MDQGRSARGVDVAIMVVARIAPDALLRSIPDWAVHGSMLSQLSPKIQVGDHGRRAGAMPTAAIG